MSNRTLELLIALILVLYLVGVLMPAVLPFGNLIHLLLIVLLCVIILRVFAGKKPIP